MGSRRYVICDIEATGLDAESDLIEIALITYEDDKIIEIYDTLINPLRPISEYISNLTQISNRELQDAPKFYEVADAIRLRLEGAVFVSHNTEFDLGLLRRKYQEMGQELRVKNFCTLKVAQYEIPGLKNYNLDALCSFFAIKIKDRHRATGDALATLELFKELWGLRQKTVKTVRYLPQHEKILKKISAKSGLLMFKNEQGKVVRFEVAQNMHQKARELLEVKAENRELLTKTESIADEVTGSALIAEFRKLLFYPYRCNWTIVTQELTTGERVFKLRPMKKGLAGHWFFEDYLEAKHRLKRLERELKDTQYFYRDSEKSKEEIVRHNQKVENLLKDARFPNDHLVIVGEGRELNEKSLILIRNQHVLGYGYTMDSVESIYQNPDVYLTRRFFQHLGADQVAKRYLRVLKNLKAKSESWRSLSEV